MREESPESFPEEKAPILESASFHDGKDELNFAEFPLGSISERVAGSQKTLTFKDKIYDAALGQTITRKLTITGSDAYGLPTAIDDEVLLGLIQLTKTQRFQSPSVTFSRYQLVKLLGWTVCGKSYERIQKSLRRWLGVSLYYDNSWRDRETNSWTDRGFHVLEAYSFDLNENSKAKQSAFAVSQFTWNEVVFRSFTQGNLKALDFGFVMGLKSAITRRLYRFLDKRFYHAKRIEMEIKMLAFEHIGLSRNTAIGDLKRKLIRAISELEQKGFLKVLPPEKRFGKIRMGEWIVFFEKAEPGTQKLLTHPYLPESVLEQKLMTWGITRRKAKALVKAYPHPIIEERLEVLEARLAKNDGKALANPAGFLIASIEEAYPKPLNFQTAAEKEASEKARQERKIKKELQEEKRRQREEEKHREREATIAVYWANLTPSGKTYAEADALERATPFELDMIKRGGAAGRAARKNILDEYALSQLSIG